MTDALLRWLLYTLIREALCKEGDQPSDIILTALIHAPPRQPAPTKGVR